MTFLQPVWLLLAIPLFVAMQIWTLPTRLLHVLRIVVVVLILLAMAQPVINLPSRAGTVVVVADRSYSMPADSEERQKEAIELVRSSMTARDDLIVVSFGQTPAVEKAGRTGKFEGFMTEVDRNASSLAAALEMAVSLIPRDGPARILLLTDGRWTGTDPSSVAYMAAARGIGIDYRLLERPIANDAAIARIEAPDTVTPGEAFMVTAWVHSAVKQDLSFQFQRGKTILASGRRTVGTGMNRMMFRDKASEPGVHRYVFSITGSEQDPIPENNVAKILVGIKGPRAVLCVVHSPQSHLPALLKAGGIDIRPVSAAAFDASLESLAGYSSVILENVPANKIAVLAMETIAAWVKDSGSGLMMTGGKSSYGPGGYFRSPLEPVMPVSMELRREHRKLSLAIVIAMDRSGSMAASVGFGKTKMDLANISAVQVLDLLSDMDEIGVIAVDSSAHTVVSLDSVANNRAHRDRILRVQSMGGGIFVYEALVAAAGMLARAQAGTRHIILFADAADSEQPGEYKDLLEKCRQSNMTVSVIGLGKPTDQDAEFLRDVARRGNGRIFFTENARELPRLFAQDTFVVARSTFVDEPTSIRATPGMLTLTGRKFDVSHPIGGYNLCYLRDGATLAAVTQDEYKAPVVAAWQAGMGRALCYTGEADGKYTGPIAKWQDVGEFFTSLVRWTAGDPQGFGEDILLTQELKSSVCIIQLQLDPERQTEPITDVPVVTVLRGRPGRRPVAKKFNMHWTSADTLALRLPLTGSETMLSTVELAGHGRVTLSPVCLPYSPEYKPVAADQGRTTLAHLAASTGGQERINLAHIWKDLPKQTQQLQVGHWLLIAAVVLFLIEVLERRTGVLAMIAQGVRARKAQAAADEAAKPAGAPPPRRRRTVWGMSKPPPVSVSAPDAETKQPAASAEETEERIGIADALAQAHRRAKRRTRGK